MGKFSVVVFAEREVGKRSEPFLATQDPEVIRVVSRMITDRLKGRPGPPSPPTPRREAAADGR